MVINSINLNPGAFEILLFVSAALFLGAAVCDAVLCKKSVIARISAILSGVVGAAYLAICPFLLTYIESDGYELPLPVGEGGHASYTNIFFAVATVIMLLGAALPFISNIGKIRPHNGKVYIGYIIVSTVVFATMSYSMLANYTEFSTLFAFVPLHLILPLSIISIMLPDFTKAHNFIICLIVQIIFLGAIIVLIAMMSSVVNAAGILICIIMGITSLFALIGTFANRSREKQTEQLSL